MKRKLRHKIENLIYATNRIRPVIGGLESLLRER